MSLATLEMNIAIELRGILKNPKITKNSIMEWSTGTIEPQEGEIVVEIPALSIYAAVKERLDKR